MIADSEGSLPDPNQESGCQVILPDDVLLAIFDFCVNQHLAGGSFLDTEPIKKEIEVWQSLVHVCRRWRSVVFGSPRRLNLRLVCTPGTPVRDTLDVWPALPLLIWDEGYPPRERLDINIIPVLERGGRVRQINLILDSKNVSRAMQKSFPELTRLDLWSYGKVVLPDSFLGGSAQSLQLLHLTGIAFPGLPNLLLSATQLVRIRIEDIPHSGYISPEAIVTVLSTLTGLYSLSLGFRSPQSRPDPKSRRPPPPTRTVLPVLTMLQLKGASKYLDDLVARIDAPRLSFLSIAFFPEMELDTPRLVQFIRRTPTTLRALNKVHISFRDDSAMVDLSSNPSREPGFRVVMSCRETGCQVRSLVRVCTSCLPPISTLEELYIHDFRSLQPGWQDNFENTLWLDLLHPFTTVRNLYISKNSAPRIAAALKVLVGDITTEVLPTLQNIFLEELEPSRAVQEGVGRFVAARQVIGHQIAVSLWDCSKEDKISRYWCMIL